jgi:hypothetical protein
MYVEARRRINISVLKARLFPPPFPFADALQRAPADLRTETLQGTSPLLREVLVASRSVAATVEKNVR